MQATLATPLDMMAVVVDKTSRKSEVIDVDQVYVVQVGPFNHVNKTAQFAVAFGGKDSTGTLHTDPQRAPKIANITIQDPEFSARFCDALGNPLRDLTQAVMDAVFVECVIPACNQLVWGMDAVEVLLDGVAVYQKETGKPALQAAQLKLLAAAKLLASPETAIPG